MANGAANAPDQDDSDDDGTARDQRGDGPDRRERLLNLLAALIETRAGLTREDLVTNPTLGYPPNPASARRSFERDKATLRAMGVPIRDIGDEAETRYRVDPKEYYLPDLGLGGIEGAGAAPIAELPFVDVLAPLFEASRHRAVVRFSYRGRERELEPWGLTSKFGHWYVVGFDRGADDMRVYRADRIEGDIETDGTGAFEVPSDFRAAAYLEGRPWDYGEGRATDVVVRVDPGYEVGFCQAVGPDATVEHTADAVLVTIRAVEFRAVVNFVLGFLDHVQILEPPAARNAVIAALDAWATA